ncbi:unnamed protein product [Triticum turgidum subsp. durum]|uniref:Auxin-responsive protein n=1 Tax=Triticum turgidum subsp. durum TaxID=4567 RepID=A0A9R1AQK1_TRITD|nr:unnamed protein product [Triticum turgidum subsp. durum]
MDGTSSNNCNGESYLFLQHQWVGLGTRLCNELICKAQAVGWPPVRSYRRNAMTVQSVKIKKEEETEKQQPAAGAAAGANGSNFVKVSMDGAPYLRKVDLKMYNTYKDLSIALQKMFSTFTATGNEGKMVEAVNGSDVVTTYEDKDGDWMLVGDVPWEYVTSLLRPLIYSRIYDPVLRMQLSEVHGSVSFVG